MVRRQFNELVPCDVCHAGGEFTLTAEEAEFAEDAEESFGLDFEVFEDENPNVWAERFLTSFLSGAKNLLADSAVT